jgi:hypothetical protein
VLFLTQAASLTQPQDSVLMVVIEVTQKMRKKASALVGASTKPTTSSKSGKNVFERVWCASASYPVQSHCIGFDRPISGQKVADAIQLENDIGKFLAI